MTTLLLALVLFSIEIYAYVNIMHQRTSNEQIIDNLNFTSDMILFNIMKNIRIINQTRFQSNDLFCFYLNKKIIELLQLSNDAVNNNEIKIEDTMIEITHEMYKSAFIGDSDSIFRPMYECNENEFFFESFGKNYFEIANQLVRQRKIKKVNRLFVYEDAKELQDNRIQKLIHFHNTTKNFECKILSKNTYEQIKKDFKLNHLTGSFAIYGSRYLYTERTATAHQVVGYYSKDVNAISNFIVFFERCWSQAKKHTINSSKKINLDDIFNESWTLL